MAANRVSSNSLPFPALMGNLSWLWMLNFYQVFWSGIFKFWNEILRVEKPDWQSENTVILDTESFKLRQFTRKKSGASILILPPQAGHHSCIADYALPGQSLVALCKENTECTVYAVEWKSAVVSRRHETIDDLVRQMLQCLDSIGGDVHVIGLCQAGWLATICASLYPEKISSLILGGAPIDFTAGGGKLQDTVQKLPMPFYESLVRLRAGLMDGRFIVTGFKNFNPYDRYVGDYMKLLINIDDPKAVDRSRRFRTWYGHTQNISGAWYLQAVYELFKENRLVKGKLKIMGRYVSLKNITCPVVLIAGANDDITLQPQLFNMAKHVSGKVLTMVIPNCGHIGLFMKKQALEGYWRRALSFVFQGTSRESTAHDDKVVYMNERDSSTRRVKE